jgi:hypothetical protein
VLISKNGLKKHNIRLSYIPHWLLDIVIPKYPSVFHKDFTIFYEAVKDKGNAIVSQWLVGLGQIGLVGLIGQFGSVDHDLSATTISLTSSATMALST